MRFNRPLAAQAAVALATLLLAVPFVRAAAPPALSTIVVTDAWTRATPPGSRVAAVYLRMTNRGAMPDQLLLVRSPASSSAMIHETLLTNGVAQMRPASSLALPGGGSVAFEPNGRHIMLMGLTAPLKAGTRLSLVLQFRSAGAVPVAVEVRPLGATH